MEKKICPVCGKEFEPSHEQNKYCSSLCYEENRRRARSEYRRKYRRKRQRENRAGILKRCVICGATFTGSSQKYCSERCRREAERRQGREYRRKLAADRPPTICPICGEEFERTSSGQKYCSSGCKYAGAVAAMDAASERSKQKYRRLIEERGRVGK